MSGSVSSISVFEEPEAEYRSREDDRRPAQYGQHAVAPSCRLRIFDSAVDIFVSDVILQGAVCVFHRQSEVHDIVVLDTSVDTFDLDQRKPLTLHGVIVINIEVFKSRDTVRARLLSLTYRCAFIHVRTVVGDLVDVESSAAER